MYKLDKVYKALKKWNHEKPAIFLLLNEEEGSLAVYRGNHGKHYEQLGYIRIARLYLDDIEHKIISGLKSEGAYGLSDLSDREQESIIAKMLREQVLVKNKPGRPKKVTINWPKQEKTDPEKRE